MIREHFEFRQTIATILADEPRHVAAAKAGMLAARHEVERQIALDPYFAATFEPYAPMAAVAGAIARAGVEAMVEAGASFGLIDNGGDIALVSDRDLTIGVSASPTP